MGFCPNLLLLPNSLSDFRTTIGAFVDQIDLRHAPVRLYVSNVHGQSHAARTNHHRWFDFVVVANVGWHVGSPLKRKRRCTISARTKASPPNVAQSLILAKGARLAEHFAGV